MHKYREGKVKSTAMSGVKQFLKPDAYKQSEVQWSGIRDQGSEPMAEMPLQPARREPGSGVLIPDTCNLITALTAYLLYNGSASWSY